MLRSQLDIIPASTLVPMKIPFPQINTLCCYHEQNLLRNSNRKFFHLCPNLCRSLYNVPSGKKSREGTIFHTLPQITCVRPRTYFRASNFFNSIILNSRLPIPGITYCLNFPISRLYVPNSNKNGLVLCSVKVLVDEENFSNGSNQEQTNCYKIHLQSFCCLLEFSRIRRYFNSKSDF